MDTYSYTALYRMASNNLADGGEVLVQAGVIRIKTTILLLGRDSTPIEIAKASRAIGFLMALQKGLAETTKN